MKGTARLLPILPCSRFKLLNGRRPRKSTPAHSRERRRFLTGCGVDRSMLRTQGYCKQGNDNHPDYDMGDDV